MKTYFKADINGRDFFRKYLIFYIPIVILAGLSTMLNDEMPMFSFSLSMVQSYISTLLTFAFFCYAIKSFFYKDENFLFSGTMREYAPRMLKWFLLTIITLGFYIPWYLKNLISYYIERLRYQDKNGEFLSKPTSLLKYMLLTLYLPILVLLGITVFFVMRSGGYYYQGAEYGFGLLITILIFLIMIPFIYFYIIWIVNFRFAGYNVKFERTLAETAGFLIVQIILCIITAFIYYPAAWVKMYRFVAEGSSVSNGGSDDGGFGFDGTAGGGFCLLWGQGLLTVITVGIYGPWAMSHVTNWFVNNTFVEGISEEPGSNMTKI